VGRQCSLISRPFKQSPYRHDTGHYEAIVALEDGTCLDTMVDRPDRGGTALARDTGGSVSALVENEDQCSFYCRQATVHAWHELVQAGRRRVGGPGTPERRERLAVTPLTVSAAFWRTVRMDGRALLCGSVMTGSSSGTLPLPETSPTL